MRNGRALEKAGGCEKENTHIHRHTPELRMEGVGMPEPGFIPQTKHDPFSENEGGGRAAPTNPTFIYATRWEPFQWEFLMLLHVP